MATLEQQPEPIGATPFRAGFSGRLDTADAVDAVLDQLGADEAALTFLFFSPDHDVDVISERLDRRIGPRGVAGTTAGELSRTHGFTQGGISGVSLHGPDVRATVDVIPQLDELSLVPVEQLPSQFAGRLGMESSELSPDRHLWFLLADGSAGAEDLLTPFFVRGASSTQLVGATLGDGSTFEGARVVFHGRTYTNAAALVLLEYDRPFELFHHQHMQFREPTFEVTGVSRGGRLLERLDGACAVDVYADALGVDRDELDRITLAIHPLGFRFRGQPLVCSISGIVDGRYLRMSKTVHPGDELRVMEPGNLVESTRSSVADAVSDFRERHGRDCRGALFFHCFGRYVEARSDGTVDALADALGQLPFAGLNTYGEQYEAMHTNHTLTGALFG